jgi:hypothetical protein
VRASPIEGEEPVWIMRKVEDVGALLEFTRGLTALVTLLAPHYGSSEPWVSDFSRPKVLYTNRYTNPPRTAVNKEERAV